MDAVETYLNEVLGLEAKVGPVQADGLTKLPLYIREGMRLYALRLGEHQIILVNPKEKLPGVAQFVKSLEAIRHAYHRNVALLSEQLDGLQRMRLIQKNVDFIVPGKQLYLPHLLMDLRDGLNSKRTSRNSEKLLPSAQCILIYHLLHTRQKEPLAGLSFKQLAKKFNYTQTAITKAAGNLVTTDLCEITGTKQKYLRFKGERSDLWANAKRYLINPVLKRVFVDRKPDLFLLPSNTSALAAFSDLNPPAQPYFAIERNAHFSFYKSHALINENEREGAVCLEVWKYDPKMIADDNTITKDIVDPLSLYLSLKDEDDARIERRLINF